VGFYLSGFIYQVLIDPILSRLHESIIAHIEPGSRVIDIACGTGSLALAIARRAGQVTGIDLSEGLVNIAVRSAKKHNIQNAQFELRDASDLMCYSNRQFDTAVISMAIHQFEKGLATGILKEMKRIAPRQILVDYNFPIPANLSGCIAKGVERLAGGDHYRNFSEYLKNGGIGYFTDKAGLSVHSETGKGNGVFLVVVCS